MSQDDIQFIKNLAYWSLVAAGVLGLINLALDITLWLVGA